MPFPIAAALGIASQIAPSLISLLTGQNSTATKVADQIGVIAQGVTGKQTPAEIIEALNHSDKMQKEMALKMADVSLEHERIHAEDRQSARNMHIGTGNYMPSILAILILAAWGSVTYVIVTQGLPSQVSEVIASRVLGMLDAAALAVIYFYFGSSAGSKEKDKK